jgi:hypothetical protein
MDTRQDPNWVSATVACRVISSSRETLGKLARDGEIGMRLINYAWQKFYWPDL